MSLRARLTGEDEIAYLRGQLAERDAMIVRLVDAVVTGRGENPVFSPALEVKRSPLPQQMADPVLEDAMLRENARIIEAALTDDQAYFDLQEWALEGRPRAQEMLEVVEARLREMELNPVSEAMQ